MEQIEKVISWLRQVYGEKPAVIGVSGGVDSAVSLTLLTRALGPDKIIPLCLPYKDQDMTDAKAIIEWNGLTSKMRGRNIFEVVEKVAEILDIKDQRVRLGNIMARVRMMIIFDFAKKTGALVCGTENKTEHYLGYFTRFGDSASDVEPIAGFYKTEVLEMAKVLGLPELFYTKIPSAGLWEGQTDEGEMGFSYSEADRVLSGDTIGMDKEVIAKVKGMVERNKFKLVVPYVMS